MESPAQAALLPLLLQWARASCWQQQHLVFQHALVWQRCNRSPRRGLSSHRTFFTAIDCFVSYGELSGRGNVEFTSAEVALGYPIASCICPSFCPDCFGGLVSVYSVLTRA